MTNANRAIALAVAGDFVLTLMDSLIKWQSASYPVLQIATMRFLSGSLIALVLVAWLRPGWPSAETVRANALRAVLTVVTATSFFYGLSKLPLADAMALAFLSPLFTVLLAVVALGERIDRRVVAALVIGFTGMLLIASGYADAERAISPDALIGMSAVVLSAVTYAVMMVQLRLRAQKDPIITIVVFQNVGPALLLLPVAMPGWQPALPADVGLFGLIGVLGVAGHLMLTRAFALAEASRLAPLHYLILVWALVIGIVAFGEQPGLPMLAGALLIVAGTFIVQRARGR